MRKDFRFFKNNFNYYKLLNGYKTKMICFYYLLIQTKFQWKLNLKKNLDQGPSQVAQLVGTSFCTPKRLQFA